MNDHMQPKCTKIQLTNSEVYFPQEIPLFQIFLWLRNQTLWCVTIKIWKSSIFVENKISRGARPLSSLSRAEGDIDIDPAKRNWLYYDGPNGSLFHFSDNSKFWIPNFEFWILNSEFRFLNSEFWINLIDTFIYYIINLCKTPDRVSTPIPPEDCT